MKSKKGIAFETLVKWFIALAVLIIVIVAIAFQKDKILSVIARFSEILRFR
ncbi:MAG: hypothetical protein KKE23_00375 [Nanoarchaeota archaeon]|nr:hypothetical protein [Nanoarchaeota archaeon]